MNLLGAVLKERGVPRQIYLMSLLEPEVGFISSYLKMFLQVMDLDPSQLGEAVDEVGILKLVAEWNNLRRCNQKLRILLKYFEGTLSFACLQTILEVDPAEFPSHYSAQMLWRSNFDSELFQVDFREVVKALQDEYDLNLEKSAETLRTLLSSKHQLVTVFRVDAVFKKGVHASLIQIVQGAKKDNAGSIPEQAVITKLTDKEELRRIQKEVSRRLISTEEALTNLEHRSRQFLQLFNEVEPFYSNGAKEIIKKDFKVRYGKEVEEQAALRRSYVQILSRITEIDEADRKQRLLMGEDEGFDSDGPEMELNRSAMTGGFDPAVSTTTGGLQNPSKRNSLASIPLSPQSPPCSSLILPSPTVPSTSNSADQSFSSAGSLDRRASTNSTSSGGMSSSPKMSTKEDQELTLNQVLAKLKVTPEVMAKWATQKNWTDRFGLPSTEKLYWYENGAHIFGVLSFPGTLYIYEHYICFQRTIRPDAEKVIQPIGMVARILKAHSPPFFDNAIQIQLKDKKTSFHFGYLDNRDLTHSLLHILVAKSEKGMSSGATLIDMGYMAVEVFVSLFFLTFFFLPTQEIYSPLPVNLREPTIRLVEGILVPIPSCP